MELKSYDDVLKLHQQFADKVSKQMVALRKPSKATGEAMLAGTRSSLKEAQEAVAALEKSKADTVQRLDKEIALKKEAVERLTRELGELEQTRTPPEGAKPVADPNAVATPAPEAVTPKVSKTAAAKKKKAKPQ